jgi:hypothetical protein
MLCLNCRRNSECERDDNIVQCAVLLHGVENESQKMFAGRRPVNECVVVERINSASLIIDQETCRFAETFTQSRVAAL